MADIVARSLDDPDRHVSRELGSADAMAIVTSERRLESNELAAWSLPGVTPAAPVSAAAAAPDDERDPRDVDIDALLPSGARAVGLDGFGAVTMTPVAAGTRLLHAELDAANPHEPLDRHRVRLRAGVAAEGDREVLLSPGIMDRLALDIGDSVRIGDVEGVRITGVARAPFCHGCDQVFVARGSALAPTVERSTPLVGAERRLLVDLPPGTDFPVVQAQLAAAGVALMPRSAFGFDGGVDLDPRNVSLEAVQAAAAVALIAGLGLLEIVLLAGAAFAVGVRRQARDIGLVAVGGGSPRDVRRVVLAQGLVLGVVGAGLGVLLGVASMYAGRAGWERLAGEDIDRWVLRPWEIAGAALIGILAGLAAALIPAIGAARMQVVDALAGRWGRSSNRRPRAPWIGGSLILAGGAIALLGERSMSAGFRRYQRSLEMAAEMGTILVQPAGTGAILAIVGGAAVVAAGLVVLMPYVIGLVARIGSRLSLVPRLAVRDASRNRHRSGPATTAIAIAVAGTVLLAFAVAGNEAADEATYVPEAREGTILLRGYDLDRGFEALGSSRDEIVAAARRPVETALPGATSVELRVPVLPCGAALLTTQGCVAHESLPLSTVTAESCRIDCVYAGGIAVANGVAELEQLAGARLGAEARDAFEAGSAIVFSRALVEDGDHVRIGPLGPNAAPAPRGPTSPDLGIEPTLLLDAFYVSREQAYATLPAVVISPSHLAALDADTHVDTVLITPGSGTTQGDIDSAARIAADAGGSIQVEDGPEALDRRVYLLISGIAGLVTLVGVAITIALSAAEGRADLATMAAVGAPPRRRRAIVAAQALFVASLGVVAGVLFGSCFAYAARSTFGAPEFTIPWSSLGATLVLVPLLAMVVAALCTPSRFPLQRRIEE